MQNVPNILSACRIVMVAPLVLLVLLNQPLTYALATALFFLVAMTDTIDGRLARLHHRGLLLLAAAARESLPPCRTRTVLQSDRNECLGAVR